MTLEHRAFAVPNDGGLAPCTVVFCGWSPPPAAGLARELLMALAQQFPGIGTSVTVPETFTPLFAAAGYAALTLQQYGDERNDECPVVGRALRFSRYADR